MSSRNSGLKPIGAVIGNSAGLLERLENIRRRNSERIEAAEFDRPFNVSTVNEQMERAKERDKALSLVRKPPKGDEQADFLVPSLYDVGGRDNRCVMDVAVFRLSKRDKRAGELIRHDLKDGYVEVSAGAHGMASVWDYDIVLMMVSHLNEAMNRYREGKGDKPGRVFRPHVSDILKFTRRGDGSRQVEEVEHALDRLRGTTIKTVREHGKFRTTEAEGHQEDSNRRNRGSGVDLSGSGRGEAAGRADCPPRLLPDRAGNRSLPIPACTSCCGQEHGQMGV